MGYNSVADNKGPAAFV